MLPRTLRDLAAATATCDLFAVVVRSSDQIAG